MAPSLQRSPVPPAPVHLLLRVLQPLLLPAAALLALASRPALALQPTPWPSQFHAVLFQNRTGRLALVDLWYDWPGGRNLNLIHAQQGATLYDVEWNNGTSFYFDKESGECRTLTFEVGILPPDWLAGAQYVGTETVDALFECHVWAKADFITYYEDVKTGHPVRWTFVESGAEFHILQFVPGETSDAVWQAPEFCFRFSAQDRLSQDQSNSLSHFGAFFPKSTEFLGRLTADSSPNDALQQV